MTIVSDANILSSLAVAEALNLLPLVFKNTPIFMPLAVQEELKIGLHYGKQHLQSIFQAIETGHIQVIALTETEQLLTHSLPDKLHAGEREALILCEYRKYTFLSNDKQAIHYCRLHHIKNVNLEGFLRAVWVYRLRSKQEVQHIIQQMHDLEQLVLKPEQLARIFAPRK